MTQTYALTVDFEAHEYDGEFYLVDEGHGTPADVLEHVAADHHRRIARAGTIEDCLLDVLKRRANTINGLSPSFQLTNDEESVAGVRSERCRTQGE